MANAIAYSFDRVAGFAAVLNVVQNPGDTLADVANNAGYSKHVATLGERQVEIFVDAAADKYFFAVDSFGQRTIFVKVDGLPSYLAFLREMQTMIKLEAGELNVDARRRTG